MTSLYIPKYKKPKKPSRANRLAKAYRLVDERDKKQCVLTQYLYTHGWTGELASKALCKPIIFRYIERHHIHGRAGDLLDDTNNIITIYKNFHELIHAGRHPATGEKCKKIIINDYLDNVLSWWINQNKGG